MKINLIIHEFNEHRDPRRMKHLYWSLLDNLSVPRFILIIIHNLAIPMSLLLQYAILRCHKNFQNDKSSLWQVFVSHKKEQRKKIVWE